MHSDRYRCSRHDFSFMQIRRHAAVGALVGSSPRARDRALKTKKVKVEMMHVVQNACQPLVWQQPEHSAWQLDEFCERPGSKGKFGRQEKRVHMGRQWSARSLYTLTRTHSDFSGRTKTVRECNISTGLIDTNYAYMDGMSEYFEPVGIQLGCEGSDLKTVLSDQPILWSTPRQISAVDLACSLTGALVLRKLKGWSEMRLPYIQKW